MKNRSPSTNRAGRRYRKLLRLFPRRFRNRFERSAVDLFRDRYREAASRGSRAVTRLWIRTAINVAVHGSVERGLALGAWMSGIRIGIWSDVRIALANARRAPGFTVTAICCLALGIAASGAVLTLFSAAILRPLPFPNEERLIRIWSEDPGRNLRAELSYPDIVDLREELTVLDLFAATARARSYFLTDDGARRVEGEAVTRYYFELLGITPFMGRLFSEAEFSREATPTMLLAYGTWNTAFGADPDIVGSIVRTERRDYTVIGVLPPGFYGTIEDDIPDLEFWVPMAQELEPDEFTRRDLAGIWTLGRLGPGVTIEQAQERVRAFGIRLSHAHPITRGPYGLRLERMGANWRENLRDQNYLLLIASGLLLGVATANVAGLLMTRTFDRRRELALRAALGAGHARIVREVFVETALLTVAGAAIGLALAPALLRTFLRIAPDEVPLYVDVSPDATALLAAAGVITLAAILATAAPAAVGLRVSPAQALRGGGRGATSARNERRAGAVLVAAEVAVSTIVIVAAGLLVRSYQSMTQIDLGYRTEGILRIAVFPTELDVPRVDQLPAFADRLRNTLLEEPGVDDVSLMWPTLPPSTGVSGRIRFDGMPDDLRNHGLNVDIRAVDPNFFPLMEIPLLAGRNVHTSDAPEAPPVVIVSESVARSMGGVDAAVGRVIQLDAVPLRVVGVVGDVIFTGPVDRRPSDLDIYRPLVQMPRRLISAGVSTRGDPRSLIAPLRARLLQLAPNSPLDWVSPLTVELADRMEGRMFYVVMLGAFAWSALLLTAVGIFAVLAHQVTRRAVEFGVRRALGARETRIVYEVMRRGIVVAVSGMGIGAVGAFLVARVLRTAVTDVAPFDIVTFGGSAVAIIVVTLIASYLPAARAARVAPVEALRAE